MRRRVLSRAWAFYAKCTHQGCRVSEVSNGTIACPCHGSIFDITDGSVLSGPATTPLINRLVEIRGGNVAITADA
ncbi:Rieske (2Fe-2S) protein [Streptomyces hokutonensis]|uniref:Rieske (2Fe-2S) protein n=1 Tax=Streptomyces hokutonensis TaxID=1306990 RepID=UPI0036BFB5E8